MRTIMLIAVVGGALVTELVVAMLTLRAISGTLGEARRSWRPA
jgi:hypothetical protein